MTSSRRSALSASQLREKDLTLASITIIDGPLSRSL
jgi:hypothetical protein